MRFAVILLFLACSVAHASSIEGRATVIDGDTIGVEGVKPRIRLDAIDAPESSQPCFDASGGRYLCGTRAAESLADIIGKNGRVTCTEKERDRYGRIVAVCSVGGTEINREMVRRGWAIEFKRYSDGRYAGAEAEAKAAKAGLWAGTFDEPAEWRKSKRVGEVSDVPTAGEPVAPLGLMAATSSGALAKAMPTTTATSCKAVKSCREAVILWCSGYSRADADGDGIPCENVCKSLAQVQPFKKEIGCER
jgi:endonuclease YncB( thermonuclease family)